MGSCEGGFSGYENLAVVCHVILYFVSDETTTSLMKICLPSFSIPSGGVSTFGPLIIKGFGYDQFTSILFNMPFGAVQLIATMGGAWLAMVWKLKGPVLMLLSVPPIIGCVMLLIIAHDAAHRGPLLVGYYLVSPLQIFEEARFTNVCVKISVYPGISKIHQHVGPCSFY